MARPPGILFLCQKPIHGGAKCDFRIVTLILCFRCTGQGSVFACQFQSSKRICIISIYLEHDAYFRLFFGSPRFRGFLRILFLAFYQGIILPRQILIRKVCRISRFISVLRSCRVSRFISIRRSRKISRSVFIRCSCRVSRFISTRHPYRVSCHIPAISYCIRFFILPFDILLREHIHRYCVSRHSNHQHGRKQHGHSSL